MSVTLKTFRLEDAGTLIGLLKEQPEAVEPGLKILDARVPLGAGTVDLLALDAGGRAVLIVAALAADDAVLLRALDAYAWCLDAPGAVQDLYPMIRLSPADPPRVVVIAAEFSEAFLRRARHLGVGRVDCRQVQVGLHLRRLESSAEPGRPPEPAGPARRPPETRRAPEPAPRPAPAPEAARPAGGRPAAGGGGAEVDERRLAVVRDYLQREFPTEIVYDFFAHDRGARVFQLQDRSGRVAHTVAVPAEVLEALAEAQLAELLGRLRLARVLRQAGQMLVVVGREGVELERL